MKAFRCIFIVLALSFIVAFPYKASAKEIPFLVTRGSSKLPPEQFNCIVCFGPWHRQSNNHLIKPHTVLKKFYAAEEGLFSPYGQWECFVRRRCFPGVASTKFNLKKGEDRVVLIMGDKSIRRSNDLLTPEEVLCTQEPCLSAKSTLGDNKTIFRRDRDRDTWSIQGTEGDNVLITLEEDKAAGHIGEEATLILRNGGSTIETSTGALPLEIMAILPASGEYELVVQQHGIPREVRFRGNYYLSIESASGEIKEIRPSLDVEL